MAALELKYTEQAVLLGKRRSLVGILTRPTPAYRTDAPAVLILNTGIVHRVGHSRMYVDLSRQLAQRGRTVIRFDFSGIGDSEPRTDTLSTIKASLADLREVLNEIETSHQLSRFVLIGLCAGADHSVLYGHTDARIVGMVLMDPTMPPTARFYFHYVTQRLSSPSNWLSVASGRSGLMRLASAHLMNRLRPQNDLDELTQQNLQFSPYLARCYQLTAERGIRLLAVFTSISARQTYQRQLLDAFPRAPLREVLRLESFPQSDHLFTAERQRQALFGLLTQWLDAMEPASVAAAPSSSSAPAQVLGLPIAR